MLILTRHPGDAIVLPDLGITIVVASVSGDRVRIGIDAPRDVRVFRDDVYQAIARTEASPAPATSSNTGAAP